MFISSSFRFHRLDSSGFFSNDEPVRSSETNRFAFIGHTRELKLLQLKLETRGEFGLVSGLVFRH